MVNGKLCARIRAENDVLIPARSEIVVQGRAERTMKLAQAPLAVLEPSHRAHELRKQGVNVGSA